MTNPANETHPTAPPAFYPPPPRNTTADEKAYSYDRATSPANHPPTQRFLLPGAQDVRSGWQRCPNNTAPHSDCVSVPIRLQRSYTPVAADVGNYLRYYVYYEIGGEWTRRVTDFTTGVVVAQSHPPNTSACRH